MISSKILKLFIGKSYTKKIWKNLCFWLNNSRSASSLGNRRLNEIYLIKFVFLSSLTSTRFKRQVKILIYQTRNNIEQKPEYSVFKNQYEAFPTKASKARLQFDFLNYIYLAPFRMLHIISREICHIPKCKYVPT